MWDRHQLQASAFEQFVVVYNCASSTLNDTAYTSLQDAMRTYRDGFHELMCVPVKYTYRRRRQAEFSQCLVKMIAGESFPLTGHKSSLWPSRTEELAHLGKLCAKVTVSTSTASVWPAKNSATSRNALQDISVQKISHRVKW